MDRTIRYFLRCTITAAALTAPVATIAAQTPAAKFVDSARVEIDRAMAAQDTVRLANADLLLERALAVFPDDPYLLHYRGYVAYRRAIWQFRLHNMPAAGPFLDRAMKDLAKSGEKLAWPETFQLMAASAGMAIGVDNSRGMELGMQIGGWQARATELGPNNPRVALLQGSGAMNTPAEYGGGAEKAKQLLERAIVLFEKDAPGPLAPAWGREEAAILLKKMQGGGVKPGSGKP